MFKKIVALGLVGLFLVVSFAVAEDSIGPYNPIADVNRDGTVDILDLVEVGQAYGSNLVSPSEPNKTVVTVLAFDREPPVVEGALVAINKSFPIVGTIKYQTATSNSSGIAVFELTPNTSYEAFAWSGAAYNYANFTTNSQGEASVFIVLGEPAAPTIRRLPNECLIFTFRDNVTGAFHLEYQRFSTQIYKLDWEGSSNGGSIGPYYGEVWFDYGQSESPCFGFPSYHLTQTGEFHANTTYLFRVWNYPEENKVIGYGAFQLDADYSAHAVVYGNFSA